MIKMGMRLDDGLFEREGLPAVKKFYDHLRNISFIGAKLQLCGLRERARRCAAQFAYFSIREQKIRTKMISKIASWLLETQDLETLLEPSFPTSSTLKEVRTVLQEDVSSMKRVSLQFLRNVLLQVKNMTKRIMAAQASEDLTKMLQDRSKNDYMPEIGSWLDLTLNTLLKRFLRKISLLLTKRVKWLLNNNASFTPRNWKDKTIMNILEGKKLSLKSWNQARKSWRDRHLATLKNNLKSLNKTKVSSNAIAHYFSEVSPAQLLNTLFTSRSRRSRVFETTLDEFTSFLASEITHHVEKELVKEVKPSFLDLLKNALECLQATPWTWMSRPCFKKQTISVGIDDGQVYQLNVNEETNNVEIILSFKPKERCTYRLHDPERFHAMVRKGFKPLRGFVTRKSEKKLVLTIPFEASHVKEEIASKTELVVTGVDLGLKTLGVLSIAPCIKNEDGTITRDEKKGEQDRYFIDQHQLVGPRAAWWQENNAEKIRPNYKRRLTNLQFLTRRLQAKLKRYANSHSKRYRHKVKYLKLRREWKRTWQKLRNVHDELARQVATRIVAACVHEGVDLIRVEDLRWVKPSKKQEIGYFLSTWQVHWFHSRIQECLTWRAQQEGIRVEKVSARNTSTHCSRCGSRGARHGKVFSCPACGLTLDADLNAARNIVQHPFSLTTTRGKGGRPLSPPH